MLNIKEAGQFYYRVAGIRKEYAELNPVAVGILTLKAIQHTRTHHTVFEGYPVPETGAAIFTANHRDSNDIYKILQASRRTGGRMLRTVVKLGLVENFTESQEYLESIEATDDSEGYHPFKAFVMRGVGVIPLNRENPDREFIRQCSEVIESGQLLGVFLQPHRYKDCHLKYLQFAAAYFARKFPTVPVYPVVFSGPSDKADKTTPDKITILKPFTYVEKVEEMGRKLSPGELTMLIADKIAEALPVKVWWDQKTKSWWDWPQRRVVELERLTASKKFSVSSK